MGNCIDIGIGIGIGIVICIDSGIDNGFALWLLLLLFVESRGAMVNIEHNDNNV